MRVSVFGLGYVGSVSAACLARDGHTVVGVDVQQDKLQCLLDGRSPVIEPGVDALLAEARAAGRLDATIDAARAVAESELSLVCVGTPSLAGGGLDTRFVERVCEEIGAQIAAKPASERHVVVIRSTVLPGTTSRCLIPALERGSGLRAGTGFGVVVNPEFLRESSAVADFDAPPRTVIGATDEASGDAVASLYAGIDAPMVRVSLEMAEMVKYCDNTWHALKIGFANEMGTLAHAAGLDSHRVMEIFCLDTKLNLSSSYLRPGQAFGGSCLPKDVRALRHFGRARDLELPILDAILPSNQRQVERAVDLVLAHPHKRVGILGLAFKSGTDDLRESPVVELVERLIGKGFDPRIYDRSVSLATLVGANRGYLLEKIPHISNLLVDSIDDLIAHADTLVIANASPEFDGIVGRCRPEQAVVDLVRIERELPSHPGYRGLSW